MAGVMAEAAPSCNHRPFALIAEKMPMHRSGTEQGIG
jgi:hypothetical protein